MDDMIQINGIWQPAPKPAPAAKPPRIRPTPPPCPKCGILLQDDAEHETRHYWHCPTCRVRFYQENNGWCSDHWLPELYEEHPPTPEDRARGQKELADFIARVWGL